MLPMYVALARYVNVHSEAHPDGELRTQLELNSTVPQHWPPHVDQPLDVDEGTMDLIRTGKAYINVHTEQHPVQGEVRGHLTAGYIAKLNGEAQVPEPVDTHGGAVWHMSPLGSNGHLGWTLDAGKLSSGITGVHIHGPATQGEVGDVVEMLVSSDKDSLGRGKEHFEGVLDLSASSIRMLYDGLLYVNLHTTKHANGEVRGQISASNAHTCTGRPSPFANTCFYTTLSSEFTAPYRKQMAFPLVEGSTGFRLRDLGALEYNIAVRNLNGGTTEVIFGIGDFGSQGEEVHPVKDAPNTAVPGVTTYVIASARHIPGHARCHAMHCLVPTAIVFWHAVVLPCFRFCNQGNTTSYCTPVYACVGQCVFGDSAVSTQRVAR